MSDGPKTIWLDDLFVARGEKTFSNDTAYIRADIVEDMRKALVACTMILGGETLYKSALVDAINQSLKAIKGLEEE